MALLARLLRASSLVWLIFWSYAAQFGAEALLRRRARSEGGVDADSQTQTFLPGWLKLRRQRVHEYNAERLLRGITRLHGVYVKFGQVLSIMVGLLPSVYRKKLASLQDAVPPRPFDDIAQAFTRSLGKRPEHYFARIEPVPIAAASLGQVHVAYLRAETGAAAETTEAQPLGQKVAVKVLYPDIREIVAIDMRVLRFAMRLFARFFPVQDLEIVHKALTELLAQETDYVHEAAGIKRMARHFAGQDDVLFPAVVDALSSREVLTMSFMEGVKITRLEQLAAMGISGESVGRKLLECFFEQLFVHRYFHADPHPGNFLVQRGPAQNRPRLVILDFGAVGEAPEELVSGLIEASVAFFTRDGDRLLDAFERMGFVADEANRELVRETVLMYFERLLGLSARTPAALMGARPERLRRLLDPEMELRQLRELARSFRSPEGWFYIERALVMMFGLCGEIAPQLDMLQVGFPYVMPLLQASSTEHQRRMSTAPPSLPSKG